MSDYDIKEYGLFSNAVSTTNAQKNKIEEMRQTLTTLKTAMNDSMSMGPIKDNSIESIDKAILRATSSIEQLATSSSFLISANEAYKKGDSQAMQNLLAKTFGIEGSVNTNGNVIDTSTPVATGNRYNLSDEDLNYLAYVALKEQGTVEGAKIELSLMANLYEKNKNQYHNVRDYVENSGWFSSNSRKGYSYPGDSYYNAAKEVLNEGNRYLSSNVVEHDCLPDIVEVQNGNINDRNSFVPGKTILKNKYGSKYVFVGFAPNGGDPFGYLV